MSIISKQIGWSNESNLLYQILKQLNKLTGVIFGLKPKYKSYVATVTQTGGDAPEINILENTIGDIVWTYDSPGIYIGTLPGAFIENKTIPSKMDPSVFHRIVNGDFTALYAQVGYIYGRVTDDTIQIRSCSDVATFADDILNDSLIEIRVYN